MTLALLLAGCGGEEGQAEERMNTVRGRYLEMTACSGHADLTADYGQRVYIYGLDFTWKQEGETVLTLTAPEDVAGVTARIAAGETALEFGGTMVETGPLDSSGLSPIDALPALLAYAREGFAAECVLEDWDGEERLHVTCRDPEEEPGTGVECELWFEPESAALLRGELSAEGFTVIQCEVSGFVMELGKTEE